MAKDPFTYIVQRGESFADFMTVKRGGLPLPLTGATTIDFLILTNKDDDEADALLDKSLLTEPLNNLAGGVISVILTTAQTNALIKGNRFWRMKIITPSLGTLLEPPPGDGILIVQGGQIS